MNSITRYIFFLLLIAIVLTSFSLSHVHKRLRTPSAKKVDLIIHFKTEIHSEPLISGKNYLNSFNEPFAVNKFKFYISQIRLVGTDKLGTNDINKEDYFLIDFADSNSTTIKFSSAPRKYNHINFLLGVDSIHNVSGAQTGALDPAKGMFWTWNSGYVMAKLEGTSILSNQPGHAITYHIGGYKEPNNVARNISLSFAGGRELEINQEKKIEINIIVDINAWFVSPHPLHIKETATCTTPGILAKNIADNYANMFTDVKIIN